MTNISLVLASNNSQFGYPNGAMGHTTAVSAGPVNYAAAFEANQSHQKNGTTTNGHAAEVYEWFEHLTEQGRSYYHNKVTNQTTWDKPERFKPAQPKPKPAVRTLYLE